MRRIVRALALLAVATLALAAPSAFAQTRDTTPRIAVMSAFAPEWQALLAATTDKQEHVLAGRRFVTGTLSGKPVLLFLSGVSMVNAAMSTQQALDAFTVKTIVFSGIAGGVDPALTIGDVVVPEQWASYLETVFAREANGSYAPPPFIKTPYGHFGMIHPKDTEVVRQGADKPEQRLWFPTDSALLAVARTVAGSTALEPCAANGKCLTRPPKVVVGGNGVSGSAFVDNAAFRAFVFDTFKAQVLDMESAATAHVAYSNGVPFIAFRSLSDLAGGGEGQNEMGTFFALAAGNSAKVVTAFLAALP